MNKDDSGFKWGPFSIVGPKPWRLQIQQLGGSVLYPHEHHPSRAKISHGPRDVDLSLPVIMKGNYFEAFTHARDLEATDWWYWDNCLLPQLMTPSPANPRGEKVWCRLVYKSTAPQEFQGTEQALEQEEQRVNYWIRRESQGRQGDWRDSVRIEFTGRTSRRVLVCLSSTQLLSHWYGEDLSELRQRVLRVCQLRGWEPVFRDKPPRNQRQGTQSLGHQLRSEPWRCVICTHSAAPAEVIEQGIPCVALGAQAIGELATTWQEFTEDQLRTYTRDQALQALRRILPLTRHKQELLTGSWSQDYQCLHQAYDKWTLYG